MKLIVATCQFSTSSDIKENLGYIQRQMREARDCGAHLAHFPEGCLSGYAGAEFKSFETFDWECLLESTRRIMDLARKLRIWVILGSSHRLSGDHKPHNSLYLIDQRGMLMNRYDKLFCTDGDLKHYSPGDCLVTFEVRGIRCGLLICHDFRYQELYREYKRRRIELVFHSFHNGHLSKAKIRKHGNIWGVIVPPTLQTYAANNYMWISASNTSARESCWPSFFVRPDGVITGRLVNNRSGILLTTVDPTKKFYNASGRWRERAMKGIYHSGTRVRDPRSKSRKSL